MSVSVAEGSSLLSECSGENSVLLDLSAMFPSLDHEVIVTVLQAHDGRVEAVVDYLMSIVGGGGEGEEEEEELQGPFSDDIGGLPEIVPNFLQEPADDRSLTESPDPLPTYEQACMPIELGPPPYISIAHDASSPAPQFLMEPNPSHQSIRDHCVPGQQETQIRREHCVPGQQETQISREHCVPGQQETQISREHCVPEQQQETQASSEYRLPREVQSSHQAAEAGSTPSQLKSQGRRGKLRKLAHKLGHRRSSDYKVDQERDPSPPLPYLRLLDDDELEDDCGTQ